MTALKLCTVPLHRSQTDRKRGFIPKGKDLLIQPVLARVCELHVEVVNDFGKDEPHLRDCEAVIEEGNLSAKEQGGGE